MVVSSVPGADLALVPILLQPCSSSQLACRHRENIFAVISTLHGSEPFGCSSLPLRPSS
jgi:hypothetical protein